MKVLVEGGHRAKVTRFTESAEFFQAFAEPLEEFAEATGRSWKRSCAPPSASSTNTSSLIRKFHPRFSSPSTRSMTRPNSPTPLPRTSHSKFPTSKRLLETSSVNERIEKIFGFMEGEIGVLQVEKKIRTRVKKQMEKTQRDYYLNEQMKAIQKELGETEEGKNEADELEAKINKTKMSKEAKDKSLSELKKLRSMSPMSAEATVVQQTISTGMLGIPWTERTRTRKDNKAAEKILDIDHYGRGKGQGTHSRISRRPATAA